MFAYAIDTIFLLIFFMAAVSRRKIFRDLLVFNSRAKT